MDAASLTYGAKPLDLLAMNIITSREELDSHFGSLVLLPVDKASMLYQEDDRNEAIIPSRFSYDSAGLSSYARILRTILVIVEQDRQLVKLYPWTLPHLITFAEMGMSHSSHPSTNNALFSAFLRWDDLRPAIQLATQASAYFLSLSSRALPSGWHKTVTTRIERKKEVVQATNEEFRILESIIDDALQKSTPLRSIILRVVLEGVLRDGTGEDRDLWAGLSLLLKDTGNNNSFSP